MLVQEEMNFTGILQESFSVPITYLPICQLSIDTEKDFYEMTIVVTSYFCIFFRGLPNF